MSELHRHTADHHDEAEGLAYLRERVDEHEHVIEGVFKNSHLTAQQVSLLSLKVEGLSGEVRHLRAEVPAMLMQSAIDIVGNPAVWEAGRRAMASHARDAAGGWLLGWLGSLLTRPLGLLMVILVLYQMGGLAAVWAWLKTHFVG
jgi:hypothetical protein